MRLLQPHRIWLARTVAFACLAAASCAQAQQPLPDAPSSQPPGPSVSARVPAAVSPVAVAPRQPCPVEDPKLVAEDCPTPAAPGSEKLQKFANTTQPLALSPAQKFHLAVRNVKDPFNLASIAFFSALDIATDARGVYGPGFKGFSKDFGTTLTEDINGQFWGTFVVASVAHQDPHYHRMPNASIKRRIVHCFDAVVIARGDDGKAIPNYEQIVGSPITAAINNLYVPYPRTNVEATVERVLVGASFEPVGNAVTEFLPDLAKRVNVRIVFVQKVMNRLYETQTGGTGLE